MTTTNARSNNFLISAGNTDYLSDSAYGVDGSSLNYYSHSNGVAATYTGGVATAGSGRNMTLSESPSRSQSYSVSDILTLTNKN